MKQSIQKFAIMLVMAVSSIFTAEAQKKMDVTKFTRLENDLTARVSKPVRDNDKGKLCALIRVITPLTELEISSDVLGIVSQEKHAGELWLYVPNGAQILSFSHEGHIPLLYEYSLPIEEATVYELHLSSIETTDAMAQNSNTQLFVLTYQPNDAQVYIDGKRMPSENGVFAYMMKKGDHTYNITADKYKEVVGEFCLEDQPVRENVQMTPLFGVFALFTLPENNFDVFVNDQLAGKTPYKSEKLDEGSYRIHVTKKNYYPIDTVFRVRKGDSQIHTIKLTSKDDSLFYNRILGGRDISFGVTAGYLNPFISSSASGSFCGSPINYSLGDSRENSNYSSMSGFTAGLFADIRLYKNFYLIAGLNYILYKYNNIFNTTFNDKIVSASSSEVNFATKYYNNYEEKYTHHILDIDLLASYRFVLTKKSSLHINVGPFLRQNMYAEMQFSGSSEYSGNTYSKNIYDNTIYYDSPIGTFSGSDHASGDLDMFKKMQTLTKTVESSGSLGYSWDEDNVFEKSPFKRFNYGLKFGLTYELHGFQLSANYTMQLSNMANDEFWESTRIPLHYQTGENAMSGYKHRLHSLEIKVGYVLRY